MFIKSAKKASNAYNLLYIMNGKEINNLPASKTATIPKMGLKSREKKAKPRFDSGLLISFGVSCITGSV